MRNGEKRYIPGTNPDWGYELPDEYDNCTVAKDGAPCYSPWAFDEPKDKEDLEENEDNDEELKSA